MPANERGQTYIVVGSVFTGLATVFVFLRFLARWKKGIAIRVDDYLLCVAVVIAFSMLGEGVICSFLLPFAQFACPVLLF